MTHMGSLIMSSKGSCLSKVIIFVIGILKGILFQCHTQTFFFLFFLFSDIMMELILCLKDSNTVYMLKSLALSDIMMELILSV